MKTITLNELPQKLFQFKWDLKLIAYSIFAFILGIVTMVKPILLLIVPCSLCVLFLSKCRKLYQELSTLDFYSDSYDINMADIIEELERGR